MGGKATTKDAVHPRQQRRARAGGNDGPTKRTHQEVFLASPGVGARLAFAPPRSRGRLRGEGDKKEVLFFFFQNGGIERSDDHISGSDFGHGVTVDFSTTYSLSVCTSFRASEGVFACGVRDIPVGRRERESPSCLVLAFETPLLLAFEEAGDAKAFRLAWASQRC